MLLRKGVYLYECMDGCEKFDETTDVDYMHAKRVCKDLEIKKLGEYRDLYLKSDILLSADVFENFRKMCLKMYNLNPLKFLPAPGLA